MLGSNLPSDNRAEGCVDGRISSLASPGRILLLGDGFPSPQCRLWVTGITWRVHGFAIVPSNNRLLPTAIDVPELWLGKPRGPGQSPASAGGCGMGRIPVGSCTEESSRSPDGACG